MELVGCKVPFSPSTQQQCSFSHDSTVLMLNPVAVVFFPSTNVLHSPTKDADVLCESCVEVLSDLGASFIELWQQEC